MIKCNVTAENQMIFKHDSSRGATYTTSLSKKLKDGTWENGFITIQFKNDVVIEGREKIDIINAWLTFYKNKEDKVIPYIFCSEFVKTGTNTEMPSYTPITGDGAFDDVPF